jgi:hypothetical protein
MRHRWIAAVVALLPACAAPAARPDDPWVVYEGGDGPGKGKHVVFVTGDEEYRSEEAGPMLAQILARRHGFTCTVLFAIHPQTGEIHPETVSNIPGLEALAKADLLVLFTRFRELPDEQMKHIVDYAESGRPIVALRTATHAFNYAKNKASPYAKYSYNSKVPGFEGGFGRRILGETWVAHHGDHGKESARGLVAEGAKGHPIVRGCEDVWGPTDVYTARPPADATVLLLGQVLSGMKPTDPPTPGRKNDPMMPLAWIRTYTGEAGKPARVFTTTLGASQDFESEGSRRLLVNACFWAVGLEAKIPERADVAVVSPFAPSPFGFGKARRGVKPADLGWKQ